MGKKLAKKLSADAIAALRRADYSGNSFRLVDEGLNCYAEIKSLMASIGGRWVSKSRTHEFAPGTDAKSLVLSACDRGEIPPSNPNDFFPTPTEVVRGMFDLDWFRQRLSALRAVNEGGLRLLEPSGGAGAIASELASMMQPGDELVIVELNPMLADGLRARFPQAHVVEGDFLEYAAERPFDVVAMNPPFAGKTYLKHIRHAMKMVSRFGVLCSVAPSSFGVHDESLAYEFAARGGWADLGSGRFEDTDVATSVLYWENDPNPFWRDTPHEGYSTAHAWDATICIASDSEVLRNLRRAGDFERASEVLKSWAREQVVSRCSAMRMDESIAREVLLSLHRDYDVEVPDYVQVATSRPAPKPAREQQQEKPTPAEAVQSEFALAV